MGAISIAFDTIIAGALALPWLLLVVHLFLPSGEQHVSDLQKWVKEINQPAAVAVLLFAATYLIGSAVSRTAQDFFNDDDLHLSATDVERHPEKGHARGCAAGTDSNGKPVANDNAPPTTTHLILRDGMTENRILASVYCDKKSFLPPRRESPALAAKVADLESHGCACGQTLQWHVWLDRDQEAEEEALNQDASEIFGLQQSALLLQSEDSTLRLRQLHDQVMVLRSAAYNGLVACAMCLFAWGVRVRREKPRSLSRWLLALVPGVIIIVASVALEHHLSERVVTDPPYMEYSLLLLAGGGVWLLWLCPVPPADKQKVDHGPRRQWAAFTILSILLTTAAALAWWASEIVYTQETIYAYDSLPELK